MRAAIYNPYLNTLGGGERYTVAVASALVNAGYKVDIEWKSKSIKKRLEERFGIDLSGVNFVRDIKRGDGYEVCFWVSDGSIPALRARKNLLHFQVPFHGVRGRTLLNKMKLFRINKIICNSHFTKEIIDKEYGVNSVVIYPPVSVSKIKAKRKQNWILFVGRFSQLTQAKNQDVLIKAFKKFSKEFTDWELILAGGVEVGVGDYLERLKKLAEGYPVRIIESPSFKEIVSLYGQSKVFWSAVGFGINAEKEPEKVEHFGISVVEAMAAGTVPIVYNAGGYKEIVNEAKTGYFWGKEKDLIDKTVNLIETRGLLTKIAKNARDASQVYEDDRFEQEFND
ncbi:MAG: glycosyltransferase family 4 protein [Patescibacteria group bacterium]